MPKSVVMAYHFIGPDGPIYTMFYKLPAARALNMKALLPELKRTEGIFVENNQANVTVQCP